MDTARSARHRELIRRGERAVEEARARYDATRWDRTFELAQRLSLLQMNRSLLETRGETSRVEILPADAGELFDMITHAEELAHTPAEKKRSRHLWFWVLDPDSPVLNPRKAL